jgi:choline dehydrogenase-like flavoprotein
MNVMAYVRDHRRDYDDWRDLGNAGWGCDEVLQTRWRHRTSSPARKAEGLHLASNDQFLDVNL